MPLLAARLLRLGDPLHGRLELQLALAEVHEFDVRGDDGFEGGAVVADNLLLHQQDVDEVGDRELAPGEEFHYGGLTHAVGTHEPVLTSVDDGHVGVVEEFLAPRGDAEAVNLDVLGVGHQLLGLVAEDGAPDGEGVVVLLHRLLLGERLLARSLELLLASLALLLVRLDAQDDLLLLPNDGLGLAVAAAGGEVHVVHVAGAGGPAILQHGGRAPGGRATGLGLLGLLGLVALLLSLLGRLLRLTRGALLRGLILLVLLLPLFLCG